MATLPARTKTAAPQGTNRAERRGLRATEPAPTRKLCTIPNVCAQLDVGRSLVYKLIDDGLLRRVKIGSRTLIPQVDIDAFLAGLLGDAV